MDNKQTSFVYILTNQSSGKIYIGYHKGSEDDSYVCSSRNWEFWRDYSDPKMHFKREIVFRGSRQECQEKESELLSEFYDKDSCYNFSDGKHKAFFPGQYIGYEIATKHLKCTNEIPKRFDPKKWLWYTTEEYTNLGYYGLKEDIENTRSFKGRIKLFFRRFMK